MTKREKAKLTKIIKMMEYHAEQLAKYSPLSWNKFTYEDHEFHSCYVCGHSDEALLYELRKLL